MTVGVTSTRALLEWKKKRNFPPATTALLRKKGENERVTATPTWPPLLRTSSSHITHIEPAGRLLELLPCWVKCVESHGSGRCLGKWRLWKEQEIMAAKWT
ncbi:hypothetical protein AMELA_G00223650 [Ameiurus melas]|uniref:Uncharacterized protein n=1 Tax=Ameiurus melas TaxID=219545 RepID=A0A7J6A0X4_AMEME|nr:hypothetical protein AMELA_G00223650 [Ameiurus melas]